MIAILLSYALGCLTIGYYLVRLQTGADVRHLGSGNVGARNVGRVLGPTGFFITVLGDFAKGMLAVWGARYAGFDPGVVLLALLAVVVGHIWPAQLGFRGGKGMATAAGALLAYDLASMLLIAGLFLCAVVLLRRITPSGLVAAALAALAPLALGRPGSVVAGYCALSLLILFAHRTNIRAALAKT